MKIPFAIKLPDFLNDVDDEIRIVGHRVSLYHVLKEFNLGHSAEEISFRFPTLKLATIHKIIAFYLDNQAEIDTYLAEYRKALDQQEAQLGQHGPSRAELLRRLEQIRLKANNAAHVPH